MVQMRMRKCTPHLKMGKVEEVGVLSSMKSLYSIKPGETPEDIERPSIHNMMFTAVGKRRHLASYKTFKSPATVYFISTKQCSTTNIQAIAENKGVEGINVQGTNLLGTKEVMKLLPALA